MKTNKLFFLFSILLSMLSTNALAYDFAVKNANGVMIYYNYANNKKEASVTLDHSAYDEYSRYKGSVVIPKEVTYNKKTLKVTSIGDKAFYHSEVKSVTIPNSVTSIGKQSFSECVRLTTITIGNGVKSIGDNAFSSCGLKTITIPNSVTSIGQEAFYGSSLTSVTMGNSVTSIGDNAFYNCGSLKSINIPNSVTSIGKAAFVYCI